MTKRYTDQDSTQTRLQAQMVSAQGAYLPCLFPF